MPRLTIVIVAATAGFVAAVVHFSQTSTAPSCIADAASDPSYSARFHGALGVDQANHLLVVTRAGEPISAAHVCVMASRVGMPGSVLTALSTGQRRPGEYVVPLQFTSGGPWQATVVVAAQAGTDVAVPMSLDVAGAAPPAG